MLHRFLQNIPAEQYLKLFKTTEVPTDIFSHVVKVLIEKEPNVDISATIIFNLCKTKNIDMTLMMLDEEEKKPILELVDWFEKESKLESKRDIIDTIKGMVD